MDLLGFWELVAVGGYAKHGLDVGRGQDLAGTALGMNATCSEQQQLVGVLSR